jgi:hypothetical protein
MDPLELSLIEFDAGSLTSLLERSELNCHVQNMAWGDAWGKLARIALYRSGPDVSEAGTTWLDALVSAGAVRSFTDRDRGRGRDRCFPSFFLAGRLSTPLAEASMGNPLAGRHPRHFLLARHAGASRCR